MENDLLVNIIDLENQIQLLEEQLPVEEAEWNYTILEIKQILAKMQPEKERLKKSITKQTTLTEYIIDWHKLMPHPKYPKSLATITVS